MATTRDPGRWLVDGMNVIGSRPDGWWRDRDAARADLARRLAAFAEETGDEVAVVFDGRPIAIPPDVGDRVDVSFASRSGPDAADDDIAARVAGLSDAAAVRVVTSDAALADRARAAGAEVVGARGFRDRLPE
jgi:predicted RNA-binding protein with PIN domain